MTLRFRIDPGDVPPLAAARKMGLSVDVFREQLPDLLARGFPQADPTTGNYDLDAINEWRRARYPHLYRGPSLTTNQSARNAKDVVADRLGKMRGG